jgi:hypothetical protein
LQPLPTSMYEMVTRTRTSHHRCSMFKAYMWHNKKNPVSNHTGVLLVH